MYRWMDGYINFHIGNSHSVDQCGLFFFQGLIQNILLNTTCRNGSRCSSFHIQVINQNVSLLLLFLQIVHCRTTIVRMFAQLLMKIIFFFLLLKEVEGFPGVSAVKKKQKKKTSPANPGGVGSIPGSERSPGGGNSNSLQYSCLGSPLDRVGHSPWCRKKVGQDLGTKQQTTTKQKAHPGCPAKVECLKDAHLLLHSIFSASRAEIYLILPAKLLVWEVKLLNFL